MAIGESSDSSPHAPVSKKTRVVWSLTGSGHRNACERRKPLLSGAFGSSRHPKTTNRVIITTACHTSHTSRQPATRRFGHPQKTRRHAPFNYRANRRLVCAPQETRVRERFPVTTTTTRTMCSSKPTGLFGGREAWYRAKPGVA